MRVLASLLLAAGAGIAGVRPVAAFEAFGVPSADSTYGQEIRFEIELTGGAPDRLQLLVRTPGSDALTVVPVEVSGNRASHVLDTAIAHITPNTLITYQWRAVDGEETHVSAVGTLRYDDDRPGLDWQSAQLGEATVHWYGGAEGQARRFGELTAVGVDQAEGLLGTELAGPVDVFVYDSQEDFFGALGPGAREWTGAAAYSEIRTIFMWLGGGSPAYLEQAMVHEVTHIVFHDATDNPYHEPARWLNEGFATWAETRNDDGERSVVEAEAGGDGLFAFEAITEQFPIGERGALLSYAQGTSMIEHIVSRYGEGSLRAIMAAYRDGASDDEALEAGTGVPAAQLYADFYAEFGSDAPVPITAEPIPASNVDRPDAGPLDPGGVDPDPDPPDVAAPGEPDDGAGAGDLPFAAGLGAALLAALAVIVVVSRRASREDT